jgi:hypothetical protein
VVDPSQIDLAIGTDQGASEANQLRQLLCESAYPADRGFADLRRCSGLDHRDDYSGSGLPKPLSFAGMPYQRLESMTGR